jgi:hypothetical protein
LRLQKCDGRMNGKTDRQTNGRKDRQTDEHTVYYAPPAFQVRNMKYAKQYEENNLLVRNCWIQDRFEIEKQRLDVEKKRLAIEEQKHQLYMTTLTFHRKGFMLFRIINQTKMLHPNEMNSRIQQFRTNKLFSSYCFAYFIFLT